MTMAELAAAAVPARHLADQATFRAVMDAMARPGRVNALTAPPADWPAPLNAGAAAIALCLFDFETPVWLDEPARDGDAAAWLRFHTGARVTADPLAAAFAVITGPGQSGLPGFALGSLDYPDRSTTLIVQVEGFGTGAPLTLSGPGIDGTATLSASPLPGDVAERIAANAGLTPRGSDFLMVSATDVAALPRSTRLVRSGD